MGAIEKFIAASVKDTGVDDIVAALLGKTMQRPAVSSQQDVELLRSVIREAAAAAKTSDVELEVNIDYE